MEIKLIQAFRHSYSKEFGRPINAETPDDYVISYSVFINNYTSLDFDVEYRSRTNDYVIVGRTIMCGLFIPHQIIKLSKKEVIEEIKLIQEKILKQTEKIEKLIYR